MLLTLVAILMIFSPGNGHNPDRVYWTTKDCDEVYVGFVMELAQQGGGNFSFTCEEFQPLHEADLALPDLHPYNPGESE